ncbi:MAG: transporter substrate-binding domain-containing protein, partial [Acidobacteriota bacterium]
MLAGLALAAGVTGAAPAEVGASPAPPAVDGSAQAVRIGLPAVAPFAAGEPAAGFLVDAWRLAAAAAGVEVSLRVGTDAEILDWLATGEVDLHGGWTLGGGDGGLHLGWPVARQCHGLLSLSAPLAFDGWGGEVIALTPAAARSGLFADLDHRSLELGNASAAVEALVAGRADLVVAPAQAAAEALQDLGRVVEQRPLHCPWMVAAAPPDKAGVLERLRAGFDAVPASELRRLEGEWRAPSAPSLLAPPLGASDEEIRFLADRASVRLGASVWIPMTEKTADGRWTGLGLETVRTVFAKIGVLPIFTGGPDWREVVDAALSGRIDGLGYTRTDPEKERHLSFTQPLVSPAYVLATRIDAPFLRDLGDLEGARLAIVGQYAMRAWVEEHHPRIEVVPVVDAAEGLRLVAGGDVQAYMDIEPAVTAVTNRLGLNTIKLATRLQVSSNMAIGVRREWTQLHSVLNRAIEATGEAERERIYRRWDRVSLLPEPSMAEVWRAAAWLASPLLLLLGALGYRLVLQRRRAAEARRQLRRQVLQLQKLEALGTLAKGVSHEFNNILQAIVGYADIAVAPKDDAERDRALRRIVRSADRAQDVVGQILAFSHEQRLENRPVDLAAV